MFEFNKFWHSVDIRVYCTCFKNELYNLTNTRIIKLQLTSRLFIIASIRYFVFKAIIERKWRNTEAYFYE